MFLVLATCTFFSSGPGLEKAIRIKSKALLKYSVFDLFSPRSRSTGRIPQENTGNRRNVEAVFRETDPVTGLVRNRQKPGKTDSRIRSPDSCVEFLTFSGGFRPKTVRFLRVSAGKFTEYCVRNHRPWVEECRSYGHFPSIFL
jgi:hypothetical protein